MAIITGCGGGSSSNEVLNADPSQPRLRIMAVGDSITHGVLLPTPSASWRLPFTNNLDEAGCHYEMVGSQTTNELHSAFVSPHEAYSAQEANHFVSGHTNWAGTNDGIAMSMTNHTPDLVLLHIGTNDVIQGQDNQQTISEIDQIVSTIIDGGSDVLVANLIPTFADAYIDNVDERIEQLGSLIDAYVTQLGNPGVQLVDVRTGYTQAMMSGDGIHPNNDGSAHIAMAFSNTLFDSEFCQPE